MSDWEEVEPHIWLLKHEIETPSYGVYEPGWYFSDEMGNMHGPVGTIEDARKDLKRWLDWLEGVVRNG